MSEPPFGYESTTDEVLDGLTLTGQRILVTGASAGLGVETARSLAARGASLVLAVRDVEKARANAAEVFAAADGHGGTVEIAEVRLDSLESVRVATRRLLDDGRPLNAIIANAGIMACPQGTTVDGFETQFGTNHLGHFAFVNRLVPLLRASGRPGRIVNLSSAGHRRSDVNLDDPSFASTPYDPWVAYGRSKTANILFSVELDRRLRDEGIRASAVHPGSIVTELGRHLTPELLEGMRVSRAKQTNRRRFKKVSAGAATTVWAGFRAAPDAVGGRYCEDCGVAGVDDDPSSVTSVRSYALDPARARALWSLSEELVGERYD